jgi:hypothetical protein
MAGVEDATQGRFSLEAAAGPARWLGRSSATPQVRWDNAAGVAREETIETVLRISRPLCSLARGPDRWRGDPPPPLTRVRGEPCAEIELEQVSPADILYST